MNAPDASVDAAGAPDPSVLDRLAVQAATLYLANLLIAPGIAFGILLVLWVARRNNASPVARSHLRSALLGSVIAGLLLVLVAASIVALGGIDAPATWVFVIIYVVTLHAALVLIGVLALVRALAGQPFRFPGFAVAQGERDVS